MLDIKKEILEVLTNSNLSIIGGNMQFENLSVVGLASNYYSDKRVAVGPSNGEKLIWCLNYELPVRYSVSLVERGKEFTRFHFYGSPLQFEVYNFKKDLPSV